MSEQHDDNVPDELADTRPDKPKEARSLRRAQVGVRVMALAGVALTAWEASGLHVTVTPR